MIKIEEIIECSKAQLPDTLEDLTQFVLVGKAKLQAYLLKLKTVNKLSMAQSIRDQALQEAQEINEAVKAAEIRIGEILLAIPKATPNNNPFHENRDTSNLVKTKSEIASEMGYSKDDVSYYQQMAKNPEVVKAVLEEARVNGEVATKADVQKAIKEAKAEQAEEVKDLKEKCDYLEFQLEEEQKKEPKVVEKIVEVVPDDYQELKEELEVAKRDLDVFEKDLKKANEKVKESSERVKELETAMGCKTKADATRDIQSFTTYTNDYLRRYGGHVWAFEKFNEMPESVKKDFVNAIKNLDGFAQQLITNLGGNVGAGK